MNAPTYCTFCGRTGGHSTANCPLRTAGKSTLAQQVAKARKEFDGFAPSVRQSIRLEGSSDRMQRPAMTRGKP